MNVALQFSEVQLSSLGLKGFDMKTLSKILLATGAALTIAAPLNAATQTTTFLVTANVNGTCSISANPIPFGTYTGAQVDQSATLQVNCTNLQAYTVTLNNGVNATGVQRRMNNAGQYIPYQIYTDAAHANIWNASTGANINAGIGDGTNQSYTMYGRAPGGGATAAGAYQDTITATVTY